MRATTLISIQDALALVAASPARIALLPSLAYFSIDRVSRWPRHVAVVLGCVAELTGRPPAELGG